MPLPRRVGRFAAWAVVLAAVALFRAPVPAEGGAGQDHAYPQTVLLIRHAEKTGDKTDVHLSGRGKERAEVLDRLFVASKERPDPFPKPDFIFAACHHKDSQRPTETVALLARRLNLPVNDRYDSKLPPAPGPNGENKNPANAGTAELRDELFGSPRYSGKTVLIAWRHSTLPELARTLKAGDVPDKWRDEIFDRVWQITYDGQGRATFRDRPQRLLPGDADK
jgi:hypothetical protein